jgi:hypothetical protein
MIEIIDQLCALISATTDMITLVLYIYACIVYLKKVARIEVHLEQLASQSSRLGISNQSSTIRNNSLGSVEIELIV